MRVLVIGAGLSGLTAARQLLKQHPNLSLTVTQALSRVGGRTNTVSINDCKFDLGAEFIGQSQSYVKALAQESGNPLLKTFRQGNKLFELNNKLHVQSYAVLKSPHKMWQDLKLRTLIWRINFLANKVPILRPYQCSYSKQWDKQTVEQWVNRNIEDQKGKYLFQMICRGIIGVQASEISFLYFLWFVHQNKNVKNLIDMQNAMQEYTTKLGTQHFSTFLAQQVTKMGGKIQLGVKVSSIQQKHNKCFVKCANGDDFSCDYLIMACSPWQANRISYLPALSRERKLICDSSFMGSYLKILLLYKRAYWRDKGFSGEMGTDCKDSPVAYVYDSSKHNQKGELQPALQVFVGGKVYRQWKERPDLLKQITSKLATMLNEPQLLHPISAQWKTWEDEESIGGAPTGSLIPGVLSQIADLRKPEKRIHWAGTELARESIGYMDGAVESGIRVASEVSSRLRGEILEQQPQKGQNWRSKYLGGVRKWIKWL